MESIEAAIRAFVNGKAVERPSQIYFPSFSRVMFLDSETTPDQYQNLIFGSYKLYENHILVDSGIYYDPKFVNKKGLEILRKHDKIDRKSTRLNSSHSQISYAV